MHRSFHGVNYVHNFEKNKRRENGASKTTALGTDTPTAARGGVLLAAANRARHDPSMTATLSLEIPRDVLESANLTVADAKLELAIALFAAARLSLGKAAELAALPVGEFQMHLGTRHLGPHYDGDDAREDRATLAALRGT